MVKTAMAIEKEIEDARSIRDAGAGGKRKKSRSSSSSRKKPKASGSRGFQGQGDGHQGQGRARAPSQVGQTTCYLYHQLGYIRWDCPQRQGSQGFRTVQSQASVGQIRTQFIPPYPSASQNNQYQSQGATQAPSVAQTYQRGQIMGRCKGHDP